MNRIINDIRNIINESKRKFRKEKLSDGSTLVTNKVESIFHRMTPPDEFFIHRPAYFLGANLSSVLPKQNNMKIKTYIGAAYISYIQDEYNAVVRHTDILIDKSLKEKVETDKVQIGMIFADDHSIRDSNVILKSEAEVKRIVNVSVFECNRYFGKKIKYIDMDDFINQINKYYGIALDRLKEFMSDEEFTKIFKLNDIEVKYISHKTNFSVRSYDKIELCYIDMSHLSFDSRDTIAHEISDTIRKINNVMKDEFILTLTTNDHGISTISVHYMESFHESSIGTCAWSDLFNNESAFLSTK